MEKDYQLISDEDLEQAADSTGTIFFIIAMIVAVALDYAAGYLLTDNLVVVLLMFGFIAVLSLMQAYDIFGFRKRKLILLISWHIAVVALLLMSVPPGSVYALLGAQLVYQSHYWYGTKASAISLLTLSFFIYFDFYINTAEFDITWFADATRIVVVQAVLSVSLISLLDVVRKEIARVNSSAKRLMSSKQRITSLMNNMTDAVLATDNNGKIIEYNSAALSLADTNEHMHEKSFSEIFNLRNEEDEQVDIIAQARREGRLFTRSDLIHRYGRGDKVLLSVSVNPMKIFLDEKPVEGFTFVIRDITKQRTLEEKRDEFISVVSHELRTPVAVSEGNLAMAEIINEKTIKDPKLAESLKASHEQLTYLSALVNDLVVLSLSEQDKTEVKIEKFSPFTLGLDIIESFTESAQRKNLVIERNFDDDFNVIRTSRVFVQEILKNFFTNAIKYTNEGFISLKITQDGDQTAFSVQDTGKGISRSDQKHIFEKFYRAEEFHTRETGGTGLGLHVSRQLADKIEGEITFTSELGSGSTFNLTVRDKKDKRDDEA